MLEFLKHAAQVVLVLFAIGLLGVAVKDAYKFITRRRRFIDQFVTQDVVTARMREFATELTKLFEEQRKFYAQSPVCGVTEYAENQIKERVDKAKNEFWANHRLAHDLGFKVPDSIKMALNSQFVDGSEALSRY
ncbi:MAG: hypothetical protein KBC06_00835 [Candidatus Pacebacteria bacterium]|nr:hypothetical protein [Candidatus Paceibacterota bacterium]